MEINIGPFPEKVVEHKEDTSKGLELYVNLRKMIEDPAEDYSYYTVMGVLDALTTCYRRQAEGFATLAKIREVGKAPIIVHEGKTYQEICFG